MKVKTSELEGAALDWAVAKGEGRENDGEWDENFSSNWLLGGPIIEREKISIDYYPDGAYPNGGEWGACTSGGKTEAFGPTPLIAAMRCFVASRLGDEVDVPEAAT